MSMGMGNISARKCKCYPFKLKQISEDRCQLLPRAGNFSQGLQRYSVVIIEVRAGDDLHVSYFDGTDAQKR